MSLSKILLLSVLFCFSLQICNSHRRGWGRTVIRRRPLHNDYEDSYEDMEEAIEQPESRGIRIVKREVKCTQESYFNAFYIEWKWTDKAIPSIIGVEPSVYKIHMYCEAGGIATLGGEFSKVIGPSDQYRTGRVFKIEYWVVKAKIYRIRMYGTYRTGDWTTSGWQIGDRVMNTIACPPGQHMYGIGADFVGTTTTPDYMFLLRAYCRATWPG